MSMQSILASFENCKSLQELKKELQSLSEKYGFKGFKFLDIGSVITPTGIEPEDAGASLEDDYSSRQYNQIDPCLAKARRNHIPFYWNGDQPPREPQENKQGDMKVLECAQKQASKKGLVIPYHFVDPVGRIYSNLIMFLWKDDVSDFRVILKLRQAELNILMVYWAQCAMDLVASSFLFRPKDLQGKTDTSLTTGESYVLSWAALGKTTAETAEIMRVELADVRRMTASALKKLNAANKTHAVSKALYLGLIEI